MPACPYCGQNLDAQALFCSRCGQKQVAATVGSGLLNNVEKVIDVFDMEGNFWTRHWKALAALIVVATGAFIFGLIFLLGKSEPAKMTLEVLRTSPVVREAVGEIRDTGWPSGGMKTASGGVGTANFEVSVEGTKAEGRFFASFYKRLGKWRYESGSLLLDNGKNYAVPPP